MTTGTDGAVAAPRRLPRGARAVAGLLVLVAAACGGDAPRDGAPRDGAPGAGAAAPAAPAAPIARLDAAVEGDSAACPTDGVWRHCSVAERLRKAGLVPHRRAGTTTLPFLSTPGVIYDVRHVAVHAFVYADSAAARRDGDALDPIRVAPRGGTHAWPERATLVRSGNLIAVLLSSNDRQIERVQLGLEAGAPRPESAPPRPE